MGTINVNRLDEAAQADNFRDAPHYSDPPIEGAPVPWQSLAVTGIVVALLVGFALLLLGLFRLIVCWGQSEAFRSTECQIAITAQWVLIWAVPLGVVGAGVLIGWSFLGRQRVQMSRMAIVRDDTGVPVSTILVHRKSIEFYRLEKELAARRLVEVAQAQPFGAGVDSLTYHHEVSSRGGELIDALPVEPDAADETTEDQLLPAPGQSTLAWLIEQGYIRFSQYDLLIGAAVNAQGNALPGKPLHLKWSRSRAGNEPVITAIAGLPGSGKTYLARSLVAQSVLKGIQVILCDPNHGSDQALMAGIEDLAPLLGSPIAQEPAEIAAAIGRVSRILENRRTGRDTSRQGVLLVIDEFTSVVVGYSSKDTITDQLIALGASGRHYGIRVLLIGQAWQTNVVGAERGGALRDLISLKLIGHSNPRQLDFLTYGLPSAEKAKLASIAQPYMYTHQHGALTKVVIPGMLDTRLVADVLRYRQEGAPQGSPRAPQGSPRSPQAEEEDDLLTQLLGAGTALEREGRTGRTKEDEPDLGLDGDDAPESSPPTESPLGDEPESVKRYMVRQLLRQGWSNNKIAQVVRGKNDSLWQMISEIKAELEKAGEL